jgi:hypothetical protein
MGDEHAATTLNSVCASFVVCFAGSDIRFDFTIIKGSKDDLGGDAEAANVAAAWVRPDSWRR